MKIVLISWVLVAVVTAQLPTELPSTCASTTCIALAGVTCKEVYNPTSGIVTGQCLSNVIPTGNENVCGSGQPLYTIQSESTVEAFCGRGLNRIGCPSGYECKIAPNDAYAVCCPSSSTGGLTKEGQCPVPDQSGGTFGICANTCSVDSDCSGSQKCCRNECGATTCQNPVQNQPVSPCAATTCAAGTRCEERQVWCVRASCPPQAVCVPLEREGVCPQPRFSWNWLFAACPTRCRYDASCPGVQKCCQGFRGCGTSCVDPDPPVTCANTDCPSERPYCIMQQVQCFKAPCFPVPACVSIANACSPPCRTGYKCEMANVPCGYFGGVCGRRPQCVQEPVCQPACGPNSECQWQRNPYGCVFGRCPLRTICIPKP